ncbi:trypsin-like peptidase domain-containing protein [Glaciibacter flavus]|uniref:trypsin-like peptidase domain-containing protein n=1 Tax=Orlajensenia flava TaxID=2565934 RepID=UPI003AFF86DA
MTDSTTPESNNEEHTAPEVTPTAADENAGVTGPTERIEPVAPTDAAPTAAAQPDSSVSSSQAATAATVPLPDAAPAAPAASQTPAAAQAPAAAPAAAAQAPAPTGAFGQSTAPQAPVYAPNAAPQAYAQQGHPTQPYGQPAYGQPGYAHPTQPYGATPAPADTKTKNRVVLPVVAALIAGALIGGGSAAGVSALMGNQSNASTPTSATAPQNVVVNNTDSVNEITAVAAKASPSVVTISVTADSSAGTGSGVVLSKDGYILTNTHVVTLDGSASKVTIQVQTTDGKLYDATVVGTDPTSDLAVIKLKDASGLTPLDFADSSKLNVGDAAVAIGAPLGLANTVTNGIVSALNRSIQVASSAAPDTSGQDSQTPDQNGNGSGGSGSPFDFWNFDMPGQSQQQQSATSTISLPVIQTDAAINPGNSGGALLNSKGQLIGINVAIASAGESSSGGQSGSIGVGFAIPANLAKRISDEIISGGTASHGLLGASVADAASTTSGTVGALIKDATSGGAADKGGLKSGDIITSFNGVPITDANDLTAQVRYLPGGAQASVSYTRDGKTATTSVTLGELKS